MLTANPKNLLRKLLFLDAGTCIAMGVLLVSSAGFLSDLLSVPAALLFYAGVILLPVAAFMAVTAVRTPVSRLAVRSILAGNVLWVVASLGLVLGAWISPNALGYAFILFQAAAVALLTVFEQLTWRRAARKDSGSAWASAAPSIAGVLVLMLTLGWPVSEAQGAGPAGCDRAEQRAVEELIRLLSAAVNTQDRAAVRAVFTDDWSYFTAGGRVWEFEEWWENISRYDELHFEPIDIRSCSSTDGDIAWATFRGTIQGRVDGQRDDRTQTFTAIFLKADPGWKLRHLQGTRLAQSP